MVELLKSVDKNTVLVGDFNLPEINRETGHAKGRCTEILEVCEEKMLEQLVEFSTHTKGNTLDLILTNIPDRVSDVEEVGRLGRSDHSMIMARIEMGGTKSEDRVERLDWNKADWTSMKGE